MKHWGITKEGKEQRQEVKSWDEWEKLGFRLLDMKSNIKDNDRDREHGGQGEKMALGIWWIPQGPQQSQFDSKSCIKLFVMCLLLFLSDSLLPSPPPSACILSQGETTSTSQVLWSFSLHLILCSCIDFHRSSGLNLVVIALNGPSGQNKHCTFLTKNGHFSSRERHFKTISSLWRGGLLPALSWWFSHMIHSLFELFLLNMLQESGLFCGGEDVRTMVFRLSDTTLPRTLQWVSCFLWMSCQQHEIYNWETNV